MCRSFVTTQLVSLGRRISADTGCAGCQRVERTVECEAHTYSSTYLSKKRQEHQLGPTIIQYFKPFSFPIVRIAEGL